MRGVGRRGGEGVESVHFHALRHLFASRLLNAGLPVQDVARVLGHSVGTLLKVYTHVLPRSNDRVAAAIDEAVSCGSLRDPRPLGWSAGARDLRFLGGFVKWVLDPAHEIAQLGAGLFDLMLRKFIAQVFQFLVAALNVGEQALGEGVT